MFCCSILSFPQKQNCLVSTNLCSRQQTHFHKSHSYTFHSRNQWCGFDNPDTLLISYIGRSSRYTGIVHMSSEPCYWDSYTSRWSDCIAGPHLCKHTLKRIFMDENKKITPVCKYIHVSPSFSKNLLMILAYGYILFSRIRKTPANTDCNHDLSLQVCRHIDRHVGYTWYGCTSQ